MDYKHETIINMKNITGLQVNKYTEFAQQNQ